MNRRFLVAMAYLVIVCGCAGEPRNAESPGQSDHNRIALSASVDKAEYRRDESIMINVAYTNQSDVPVDVDEGALRAVFRDKSQETSFTQAVRASCKRGHKTVTLQPGDTFQDVLTLMPKRDITPGTYTVEVLTTLRFGRSRLIETGKVAFKIK